MADGVVIGSMKAAVEASEGGVVGDVLSLFRNQMNDEKVVVIVEGSDDEEVYRKVFNPASVCIYVDNTCAKHVIILNALNSRYCNRLLAIKDADFDRLEGVDSPYSNMLLTDTHDMEGMIVEDCLPELQGDDAERCENINLSDIYSELEDISYLKWFNHVNHYGINFSETTFDSDINAYFNACVAKTDNVVNVILADMYVFKKSHSGAPVKELCNGHDILERIYVQAKIAKVANFAKKPFFRRLRRAYPSVKFIHTSLYQDIRKWEAANGHVILVAA